MDCGSGLGVIALYNGQSDHRVTTETVSGFGRDDALLVSDRWPSVLGNADDHLGIALTGAA